MRFASTVSQTESFAEAARELTAGLPTEVRAAPDLTVLFFTADLRPDAAELAGALRAELSPRIFLAVSCEGVVGGDIEIERRPGAALLAASLPGAVLRPFHIAPTEWRAALTDDERLLQRVGTGEQHQGQLVLGDPFTTPITDLLKRLDETLRRPTFGGMASAAQNPGGNLLILDDQLYMDGAIGLGIGGCIRVDTVVSQGCRPIGDPMVVTKSEQNLILELGRRPALQVAQEMLQRLTQEEMELVSGGLLIGVVIDEYRDQFGRGDFLVRGLLGADPGTGALAVADMVRPGQTVQFHVRDASTAREDLMELLGTQKGEPPAGALIFSCNGRGTRMFPEPHADIRTTHSVLAGLPVAGFFAMGELGPVGGKSFIHGHTASLALFREG